ncbi:MAG TPA: cell surface protein [Salegentibacter sp.]|uniref:tetratricopeptide repeat protein n=1 Tax=Salegentibacter sp. TaxID=1903072 RepID=UPI002F93B98F
MFKKYYLTTAFLTLLAFASCDKAPEQITNKKDYEEYLQNDTSLTLEPIKKDRNFWKEKLEKNPGQFPYLGKLAASQSQLFDATGEIKYLIKAEENLIAANKRTGYSQAGYLRSLARNYISQHRFRESLNLLNAAEAIGENINDTHKMLFDVYMELGNYGKAETYLEKIEDRTDFDFLIRYAKWSDHEGDLSTAITYMEKAMEKAEASNLKALKQWAYTNIADFYGHNGEIRKSYNHFLKALELDPNNAYAKKGISWIVYSYERNPKEALRILNTITKQNQTPDYYLLKAEIAEFMNTESAKRLNLASYWAAVSNENYGVMYNSNNAILYAEEFSELEEAMHLAQNEIENRPTPQSYALLAWTYYHKGEYENALEIAEKNVVDKTHEPESLFHMAKIYKANGKMRKARVLKEELLESVYELGPVTEQEIRKI